MNLDGFHDVPQHGRVGKHVHPSQVESGQPLDTAMRRDWRYEGIPEGVTADRYYYTVEDLAHLMNKSPNTVRTLAKEHGWRFRQDTRFNTKAYYLYDLLVSTWEYITHWEGNNIDPALLTEAKMRLLTSHDG